MEGAIIKFFFTNDYNKTKIEIVVVQNLSAINYKLYS